MNLTKRGIISIGLILLAFVVGSTTPTGFSIGDKVFLMIGISPWSNGLTGFHYTVLVTFSLLIMGILLAKKEITGRRLLALIVVCILLTPWTSSISKTLYYKTQEGLAGVEYDYANSHFYIKNSDDDKNLLVTGVIILTNYGMNPVKVGVKISSNGFAVKDWFSQDVVLTEGSDSEHSDLIYLSLGEKRIFWTFSTVPAKGGSYHGSGTFNGPDLILFNDNENKVVGHNL